MTGSWRAELRNWPIKLTLFTLGQLERSKLLRPRHDWEFQLFWKDPTQIPALPCRWCKKECDRLGITLPPDHEHAYDADKLRREEEEYRVATRLLCPSEFVVKTFLDKGFQKEQLVRHIYGYDEQVYFPSAEPRDRGRGLTMLFVGVCAVRKGVHYALEAWLKSPACRDGTFLIAGEFLPAYEEKLSVMLAHPSVKVLGHRNDVPNLMRRSDILVLPSIEEGFGLVITEAMGSGCVPLASEACTEICSHMKTGLMHKIGDVEALTQHITMLHEDRTLLERLRAASLKACTEITWTAAGCGFSRPTVKPLQTIKVAQRDCSQSPDSVCTRA